MTVRYLDDDELSTGRVGQESAWAVGEYEAQVHNETEPRALATAGAPDPHPSDLTGEEG